MNNPIIIAIDAMGGDNSPNKVIEGISLHSKLTKNVYGDSSSTTYTYSTSGVHTLTLASGYSSGTFDIRGAQGGANSRGTMGGKGGKVTGSFSNLSAGSVLKIYVGGVGGNGKQGQSYTSYTAGGYNGCLLYTSPSPRDTTLYRIPSSA